MEIWLKPGGAAEVRHLQKRGVISRALKIKTSKRDYEYIEIPQDPLEPFPLGVDIPQELISFVSFTRSICPDIWPEGTYRCDNTNVLTMQLFSSSHIPLPADETNVEKGKFLSLSIEGPSIDEVRNAYILFLKGQLQSKEEV